MKRHYINGGEEIQPFRLKHPLMMFVLSGEGKLELHGQEHSIKPETCWIVEPHTWIKASVSASQPLDCYLLEFNGSTLPAEPSPDDITPDTANLRVSNETVCIKLSGASSVIPLLDQMSALEGGGFSSVYFRRMALFYELLHLLSQMPGDQNESSQDAIQRTIHYMNSHFMEQLQVGRLPQMANLTPSAFCRAFKKITGMSPSGYLTELRIRKAKELLLQAERGTLREIASSVGFNDELYFSRIFKKSEGMSPTAYTGKNTKRIAIVSHLFLQDHLLALGVKPVAAPAFPSVYRTPSGFPSYLQNSLHGTKPLNAEGPISVADVQSTSPDLIIKMDFAGNPTDGAWLSASNTVFLEGLDGWKDYVNLLSGVLGRENRADAVIGRVLDIEQNFRSLLEPAAHKAGQLAIIRVLPGEFRLFGSKGHALSELIYESLGFHAHPGIRHSFYKSGALEDLLQLDPDSILVLWSQPKELLKLRSQPFWQELRAVRAGKVYVPNSHEWDPWGPLGREFTIYDCARYFTGTQRGSMLLPTR
ncbi:helix-turn-helix domain-containing protein [Paenibacillus pasadenensis]|nr:helix-turn-helix domain-containing protein [Paenibacillus pasadenensis]